MDDDCYENWSGEDSCRFRSTSFSQPIRQSNDYDTAICSRGEAGNGKNDVVDKFQLGKVTTKVQLQPIEKGSSHGSMLMSKVILGLLIASVIMIMATATVLVLSMTWIRQESSNLRHQFMMDVAQVITEISASRTEHERMHTAMWRNISLAMAEISDNQNFAAKEISSNNDRITHNLTTVKNKQDGILAKITCVVESGFFRSGKCYTIPFLSTSYELSYSEADTECSKIGGLLAEIHDLAHQTALENLALSKMTSGQTHSYLWVGMEYLNSTQNLRYRSGTQLRYSYFRWKASYPVSHKGFNGLRLYVRSDGTSTNGLQNYPIHVSSYGVICEKNA